MSYLPSSRLVYRQNKLPKTIIYLVPEALEVIEYQRMHCTCPDCREVVSGEFSEGVQAPVQYGTGVKALTTLLSIRGCLWYDKIKQQLFNDLFSVTPSMKLPGTAAIKRSMRRYNSRSKKSSGRCWSNKWFTLTKPAFASKGVIIGCIRPPTNTSLICSSIKIAASKPLEAITCSCLFFRGWAAPDCMGSYFNFTDCEYAFCGAHLPAGVNRPERARPKMGGRPSQLSDAVVQLH